MVPTLYRNAAGDPRVRLLLALAPYQDPAKLVLARTGGNLPAARIVAGGTDEGSLKLGSAFPEQLTVIGGAGDAAGLPMSVSTGAELVLDVSLEFYQFFCTMVSRPEGVNGQVQVPIGTAPAVGDQPAQPRVVPIPVALRLDRVNDLPCVVSVPQDIAAPQRVTVTNTSGAEISLGGCAATFLQVDADSVVPIDTYPARCSSTFPVVIPAGGSVDLELEPQTPSADLIWETGFPGRAAGQEADRRAGRDSEEGARAGRGRRRRAPADDQLAGIPGRCPAGPVVLAGQHRGAAQRPGMAPVTVVLSKANPSRTVTLPMSLQDLVQSTPGRRHRRQLPGAQQLRRPAGHVRWHAAAVRHRPGGVSAAGRRRRPGGVSDGRLIRACVGRLSLLQHRDGSWSDFQLAPGTSTSWVTGYTGCALAVAAADPRVAPALRQVAGRVADRALSRVLTERSQSGGWGYRPDVRPDADSTAWVLRLIALRRPAGWRADAAAALAFLDRHATPGGYRTYADASTGRWADPSPDITAAVLMARRAAGDLDRSAQAHTAQRLADTAEDGRWQSLWWTADGYPTAVVTAALALAQPGRVGAFVRVRMPEARASAFQLATELWTAASAGDSATAALLRRRLRRPAGMRALAGFCGPGGTGTARRGRAGRPRRAVGRCPRGVHHRDGAARASVRQPARWLDSRCQPTSLALGGDRIPACRATRSTTRCAPSRPPPAPTPVARSACSAP